MAAGDVVLHNHPYHGASHVPDICCIVPVFYEDELVGFSANTAHHVDLGAATPGIVIDIPDVFAEGMLFSGVKLYEEDRLNRALRQHIETNTRVPRDVLGDIEAQVASARLGVRRFQELYETYGKATLEAATAELMDYSERMLRRASGRFPTGTMSPKASWTTTASTGRCACRSRSPCGSGAIRRWSTRPAPRPRWRPPSTSPSRVRPR